MTIQNYSEILKNLTAMYGHPMNWIKKGPQYISDPYPAQYGESARKIALFLKNPSAWHLLGLGSGNFQHMYLESDLAQADPLSVKKNTFKLLTDKELKSVSWGLHSLFKKERDFCIQHHLFSFQAEIANILKFDHDQFATYTIIPANKNRDSYFAIQISVQNEPIHYNWILSDDVRLIIQRLDEYLTAKEVILDQKSRQEAQVYKQQLGQSVQVACLSPQSFKKILDRPPMDLAYQVLFKQSYFQPYLCDFILEAHDQHQIPVPTIALYHNGGEAIKKDLKGRKNDKIIKFSFSYEIVKTFANFIYLGRGKGFLEELQNSSVDLFELLEFGYQYDIDLLIDCCIRCMSSKISAKNLEGILALDKEKKIHNEYFNQVVSFLLQTPLGKSIVQRIRQVESEAIIQNRDLFWSAYCKIVSTRVDENFEFASLEIIEDLRKHFLKNKDKNSFKIMVPHHSRVFMFKEDDGVSLDKKPEDFLHYNFSDYQKYVQPFLKQLAAVCGFKAFYTEELPRSVKFSFGVGTPSIAANCSGIQIEKNASYEVDLGVLIPNKALSNHPSMYHILYGLHLEHLFDLEKHDLFDFILKSNDDDQIPVHRLILYLCGGEAIQKMVSSDMKESRDKAISFPFSGKTVKDFVDFVYLGGEVFEAQFLKNPKRDNLFELLEFANLYRIPALFDCCVNAINISPEYDIEDIKAAAKRYKNPDLKKFVEIRNTTSRK